MPLGITLEAAHIDIVAIQFLLTGMRLELVFYKIYPEVMRDGVALLVLMGLRLILHEVRTEVVRYSMALMVGVHRGFVGDELVAVKSRLVW